jgi:D-3-phosphoglycerate dehydrogenase
VIESLWDDPSEVDITAVFRRIEKNGPGGEPIPSGFIEHKDVELLAGSFCPFSAKGMDVFENLHIIGVIRAGLENIDIKAASQRSIAIVNASGRNADAVSDFTIGMMLAEARNIARSHHSIMNGGWQVDFASSAITPDLRGKTIGLFGFGVIGKLMAEKLNGFHINLIVYDPFIKQEVVAPYGGKLVDKTTLFKESDFVSVHARLTNENQHIIGKAEFEMMKPNAFFINTARAGLVDYEALVSVLGKHSIAGAGLDVFENEPLRPDDPLRSLDNVTLTTHRAGATLDAANNSPRLIFERMRQVIAGEPSEGFVNPQVLENAQFQAWRQKAKVELGL